MAAPAGNQECASNLRPSLRVPAPRLDIRSSRDSREVARGLTERCALIGGVGTLVALRSDCSCEEC